MKKVFNVILTTGIAGFIVWHTIMHNEDHAFIRKLRKEAEKSSLEETVEAK